MSRAVRTATIVRSAGLALSTALAMSAPAMGQYALYNDGRGRDWNQPILFRGVTWAQVAQVCPSDGVTPCSGTLNGQDVTGWRWGTQAQVREMFSNFAPAIISQDSVFAPAPAIFLLGMFRPTQAFYSTYSNSESISGWTATMNADGTANLAGASASWPVISGGLGVSSNTVITQANPAVGLWLWRPAACPCDINSSGSLSVQDVFDFFSVYFAGDDRADFNRSGECSVQDIFDFLASYFAGC